MSLDNDKHVETVILLMDMRMNYNVAKSGNIRQLKCPPEKVKAIREALELFEMI